MATIPEPLVVCDEIIQRWAKSAPAYSVSRAFLPLNRVRYTLQSSDELDRAKCRLYLQISPDDYPVDAGEYTRLTWEPLDALWGEFFRSLLPKIFMRVTVTSRPDTPSLNADVLIPEEIDDGPWMQIPDRANDRKIVELYCQGHTLPQIAAKVHLTPKRVNNRLSELRKEHNKAKELIPRRRLKRDKQKENGI